MQQEGDTNRRALWLASAFLGLASTLAYSTGFDRFDQWTLMRPIAFFGMGTSLLGLIFLAPKWRSRKTEIASIMGLALLLRLALVPTPESDDIYRYLWEGKLVTEGISPYSLRGDHPDLEPYRDQHWDLMNNKDKLTAYPPGSLLAFAAIAKVSYNPLAFKAAFILCDLLIVYLLILILRRRHLPLRNSLLYVANPVVLVAFAGEGHFDVLMLLALAATALCVDRKSWVWAGCFLAIAAHFKFIALLALPLLLWKGRSRSGISFTISAIILTLPFAASLPQLWQGLYQFAALRDFNGLPNLFGNALGLSREDLHRPLQLVFALVVCWRLFRYRSNDDWHAHWFTLCGALLLLAPTVHFWYLTWIALPLVLQPSLLWLGLCLSQGFYFLVWREYTQYGNWDLQDWQSALLWSPALILSIPYAIRFARTLQARKTIQTGHDTPPKHDESILVIIPTLNAENTLENCLDHIQPELAPCDRILLCDASSTDRTLAIAKEKGVAVTPAPKGRGNQIQAGLEYQESRYAVILHADTLIHAGSLTNLRQLFRQNPHLVGGAFGQRFRASGYFPYRLIEFLNEFRSTLWSVSFGDQAQFFDRRKLPNQRFPEQPLMEDIELSLRLNEVGPLVYLGQESSSDPSKWQRKAPSRILLVLNLVAKYLIQRIYSEKQATALSHRLYEIYYGK